MSQDLLETDKNLPLSPGQEEEEIDLGDLLATLFENKWLIIFATVLGLLIGITKVTLDTPVFMTDAMLQVEEHSRSLPGLEQLEGFIDSKLPVLAEIEIIKSRKILGQAVKNLDLEIIAEPNYFPVIGRAWARHYSKQSEHSFAQPLLSQDKYAWGGERLQIDSFDVPNELVGKTFILKSEESGRFKLFLDEALVLEGTVGQLMSAGIEGYSQPVSVFVSVLEARSGTLFNLKRQSLTAAIEGLKTHLTVSEKGKNTGILAFSLESPDPKLAVKQLNEIAHIYVKQNIEQKSQEAQKTLEFLDKQLPLLKNRLDAATAALNDYRTHKGSIDLDIETQGILQNVVEQKTQVTLLQQKRDELREKFTPSHPAVQSVDKQIARLQGQLQEQEKKISTLPETQQIILRLSEEVKVNSELYTSMLNSAQTYRMAKAGTVGNVRIIDEAVMPDVPVKPKKPLIIAVASILGLIIGIVLAFVKKSLNRGVEDPDLLEQRLGVPVYATVTHSEIQEKLSLKLKKSKKSDESSPALLALEHKEDLAIESLRSLRTTLHFAFLEAQNNILMISGPSPGVGKTFVSSNLAVVLADTGKKVLLIDGDMRKGFINKVLGFDRSPGLSDLISTQTAPEDAIRKIPGTTIDFLATGAIPPNPSELLLHERFGKLLDTLSQRYDHIIIDSPPILAVTDASIIGRMAGGTLMVVKAGAHPVRELEQATKRLARAGVPLKGIVFNDLPKITSRYGAGYKYKRYVYQYDYAASSKK